MSDIDAQKFELVPSTNYQVLTSHVEFQQVGSLLQNYNRLRVVSVVKDLNSLAIACRKVLTVEIERNRKNGATIMLNVRVLTLLVQTVNSTHIGVLPAYCDMETLIAELNVAHWRWSSGCTVNWSDKLHSSFFGCSDIVNIDCSVGKTNC